MWTGILWREVWDENDSIVSYLLCEISLTVKDTKINKHIRRLGTTLVATVDYGGDMPEGLACELLDDMDFSFNKVCFCKDRIDVSATECDGRAVVEYRRMNCKIKIP